MERESPDVVESVRTFLQHAFEEAAGPFVFGVVRTGGDERKIGAVLRNPCRETTEFGGVFTRSHFAAAAPGFVADAPVTDVEWIFASGGGSEIGQGGAARGRVAIFDPAVEIAGREAADVGGEIRLASGEFAELDELVGAEFVGVVFLRDVALIADEGIASPEVGAPRALGGGPDAVFPVVTIGKAAAGPADDWGGNFL